MLLHSQGGVLSHVIQKLKDFKNTIHRKHFLKTGYWFVDATRVNIHGRTDLTIREHEKPNCRLYGWFSTKHGTESADVLYQWSADVLYHQTSDDLEVNTEKTTFRPKNKNMLKTAELSFYSLAEWRAGGWGGGHFHAIKENIDIPFTEPNVAVMEVLSP